MRALFLKEWTKLRFRLAAILLVCLAFQIYFAMSTRREFMLEHAEMIFYQAGRIGRNVVADFQFVPAAIGALLAFLQFAPEVTRGRLRLSLHLPIGTARMILIHIAAGAAAAVALFAVNVASIAATLSAWFPAEYVWSALGTIVPWLVAGAAAYLGGAAAMLEPRPVRRGAWLAVAGAIVALCHVSTHRGAFEHAIWGLIPFTLLLVPTIPWLTRRFRDGGRGTVSGFGRAAGVVLILAVLAVAAPLATRALFEVELEETQILYSPVSKSFVYREHLHDHEFRHATREGRELDRKTFQTLSPFIFNRDMEVWGLTPITIDGRVFDRRALAEGRMIFELKPRDIADRRSDIRVWPLIESEPGQARLQFPEDVFRFTPSRMEFLNVDTLEVEEGTTRIFTDALKEGGFAFPPRLVEGRATILKPFDEGYLVVDARGVVFHVKRAGGRPAIVRTSIPADLDIRSIQVAENATRRFLGTLLTRDGRLFMIGSGDHRLLPLPTEGYDPDRMTYKLIVNPVAPTATWGDARGVRAAALDPDTLASFDTFERAAPERTRGWFETIVRAFVPFEIRLEAAGGDRLEWAFAGGDSSARLMSFVLALITVALARRRGDHRGERAPEAALLAALTLVAGPFGWLAASLTAPARA